MQVHPLYCASMLVYEVSSAATDVDLLSSSDRMHLLERDERYHVNGTMLAMVPVAFAIASISCTSKALPQPDDGFIDGCARPRTA